MNSANWAKIFALASAINDDGQLKFTDPADAAALTNILRYLDESLTTGTDRAAMLFQWMLILDNWFGWDMPGKDQTAENNTYKIVIQAYLWGWLDNVA